MSPGHGARLPCRNNCCSVIEMQTHALTTAILPLKPAQGKLHKHAALGAAENNVERDLAVADEVSGINSQVKAILS